VVVREAWRLTAPPAEAEAEEQAVIEAAGDSATEAGEVAEEGSREDAGGDQRAAADQDGPGQDGTGENAVDENTVDENTVTAGRGANHRLPGQP
jgi:hypothetical protein